MLDVIYTILNDLYTNGHCSMEVLYHRCNSGYNMKTISGYMYNLGWNIKNLEDRSFLSMDTSEVHITDDGIALLSKLKAVRELISDND